MSTQKRSVLKNWFRKGLTPTQEQFADAFDSFIHKNEDIIPLNNVAGLSAALETKKYELQIYLNNQLSRAIDQLDSRVNDNSDATVSDIKFVFANNMLCMELTMLSGRKITVPSYIPIASTESNGLMSSADKQRLDEAVTDISEIKGRKVVEFDDVITTEISTYSTKVDQPFTVLYSTVEKCFVARKGRYYKDFMGSEQYNDDNHEVLKDRVFFHRTTHKPWVWSETQEDLVTFSSDIPDNTITEEMLSDELLESLSKLGKREVVMIDIWGNENTEIVERAIRRKGLYYYKYDTKELYVSDDTFDLVPVELSGDVIYVRKEKKVPYIWQDDDMQPIAQEEIPSSIFNATNEIPIRGYYVLSDDTNQELSAVHAAWNAGKAVSGLIISFEIGAGIWKTYQYIGKTVTETNWMNEENWKDFGSLAAGSEPYIIIDDLIGAPVAGEFYTLETAVTRLVGYQRETGVTYAKKGLVISYRTAENVMETKQFQGEVTGFSEIGLWKDFGGGSKVETSDTPEENGKDALSTGGAYTHIPAGINVDTETEGVVKMKLVNAKGDDVGDEVQFNVGTGSGGGTGTTIAVAFKENPFYGKAGGSFVVKAAIMSVTKAGSQETSNSIMSVNFVNRTTRNTVAFFNPRKASSATLTDYSFDFDLSSLAQNAGELPLQAVITDDGGNTATKNISIIAIDVTCESVQTLNYTRETSLQVGGQKTSIPMYRFPNNASDKGIRTKVEMFKNGDWETIQDVVVNDTYPHNVSIDPTGLGHGAYPIRIQGTDVASGTKGNVLHTAVMVIEQRDSVSDYDKPIVVARWSDDSDGEVKLFETLKIDLACYQRSKNPAVVEVTVTNQTTEESETLSESSMYRNRYYSIEKRIVGYSQGDTLVFDATCGSVSLSEKREVLIDGSLLDIAETEGALYKISLAGRSNTDTDKSIKTQATDGTEKEIIVTGSNYSTNGFVLDTFGTEQSGGRMSLRVAENVKAECTDQPFASTSIPTNGLALSITCKVKNIAKRNAHIIKCLGERLGFVLTGEKFIVTTNGDSDEALANVHTTAATSYLDDVVYRFDIVIEPQARAPYSGVMLCKVFQNGDMAACVPIDTSSAFPVFGDTIHFDGSDADLYLYEIVRWNTYYDFIQAFNNYIVNLTDTQAMLTEYEQNQVMADVTAEGVTKPRPDMQKLIDRGVMVCVETRTSDANLSNDGAAVTDSEIYYPDYIENLTLRLGSCFDESPVKSPQHRTERIPCADRVWLSTGVGYTYENISIDLAYTYIFVIGNTEIDTMPNVKGEYFAHIHVLGLQLGYKF